MNIVKEKRIIETKEEKKLNDPQITGKEETWEFQGVKMSAVFRHKGTPEHGYIYVYQLHARMANKDYGHIYNPNKFTFEEARKHFEKLVNDILSRQRRNVWQSKK